MDMILQVIFSNTFYNNIYRKYLDCSEMDYFQNILKR